LESDNDVTAQPDWQRIIAAQALTIQALQRRLWQLEMTIVDAMTASLAEAEQEGAPIP
jgi:RecA/RadA recombinase